MKHEYDSNSALSITQTTNGYLSRNLEELEKKRNGMGLEGDYTSGLHDDPALVREMQDLDRNIDKVRLILHNSQVLPPRSDISKIDIGNRVKIKFEIDDSIEVFRVGTTTDASYSSDECPWISVASPLGKELPNKKKDDIVSYKIGDQITKVSILEILKEK